MAHSRFKIPVENLSDHSTCSIAAQSMDAQLIRRAKIVLWDEASMVNRWALEAVDPTLRDIRNCPDFSCLSVGL